MLHWRSKMSFQAGNKYSFIDWALMPQDVSSFKSAQVFLKMLHWSKLNFQDGHKFCCLYFEFWGRCFGTLESGCDVYPSAMLQCWEINGSLSPSLWELSLVVFSKGFLLTVYILRNWVSDNSEQIRGTVAMRYPNSAVLCCSLKQNPLV